MKAILPLILVILSVVTASAQDREFRRTEFFAGYSLGSASVNYLITLPPPIFQKRVDHHGFEASAVVNVSRYFGLKGDFSAVYKRGKFAFKNTPTGFMNPPTFTYTMQGTSAIYNFLGGVQIKDNSKGGSRLKPFAHAMIGAAHRNDQTPGTVCVFICPGSTVETGFAGAFGGGLDVRIKGRIAFRVAQFDYNPVKFSEGTDNNFRFSTGIVF